MNKLENIYCFILSKILLKFIAISICCFVVFNGIFSSLIVNINSQDLLKISSIQKDVFSAIFFVSNTIEKIDFSLTQKIVPIQNQKQNNSKEQKKENPYKYNIFIFTSTQNNEGNFKQIIDNLNPILNYKEELVVNDNFKEIFLFRYCLYAMFLTIMMFFSTIKKIYENIAINYKYILEKNSLVV